MIVIPAIDLMGGKVVRLAEGDPERATVYADDPLALVRAFATAGATRVHVVDLDGAFAGEPRQLPLVAAILLALPGTAAETHPFSIHDVLAMDRISDAQVSPDGTQAAFVLRTTDLAANKGRTDLWLLDVRTKAVRRLTTNEASDSNPRWSADGKSL
ncbi:MAG TPA: HisA/HisF-related TIM barrel protein, partial [Nannocystaceae bacterium]|nr:HisA/HisF-related TIM barrel protein [Nannocystaceae bacterium]